jgi:hypothetical protein
MKMEFECPGAEVAEVMEAIARRLQVLVHLPSTSERYASIQRLKKFADKMGPVIHQGMAEESERSGRLN